MDRARSLSRSSKLVLYADEVSCWRFAPISYFIFRMDLRRKATEAVLGRVQEALPPSARYERRVGVSLVRAAWERRPEGPAYLLSSVTLLYLAGLCAF